jgi:outer membrane murein-binding lipoprotein Lpp
MDDANEPATKGQKKRASPRKRGTAEAAATTARTRTGSVSVPTVPKRSAAAPSITRRTSALPVGILTATLLLVSVAALVSEVPAWFGVEPSEEAGALSRKVATPSDPLAPQVRESLNQELRLATLGLDLRQSQEGIVRLTDDARALTESVQVLASGFDELKSDVSAARIDAAAARARIEERVQEVANLPKPVLLGDPALRKVAHQGTSSSDVEASDGVLPAKTGGVGEMSPPAEGTVTVALNDGKPQTALKPVKGWHVHQVHGDVALVSTGHVYYSVRAGHVLPGPGVVRAIRKRGDQWVVLTAKGVISANTKQ